MILRIVEDTRVLFTLDTRHPSREGIPVPPFAQRIPARGEQVVVGGTEGVRLYHVLQVQHTFGLDTVSGLSDVLAIDVQVRFVTPLSGFNPLNSGVA